MLSGYHLRSYVTFVKEYLPSEIMKLRDMPGIKSVHAIISRETGLDTFVLVSTSSETLVLVPLKPGQFEPGTKEQYPFEL